MAEEESVYIGYKYYETRYYDSVLSQGNASAALQGETADGGDKWDYDKEVSYSFGYGTEGSVFREKIKDVNNVVFHHVCSQSDQLTGDYTVAAAELAGAFQ